MYNHFYRNTVEAEICYFVRYVWCYQTLFPVTLTGTDSYFGGEKTETLTCRRRFPLFPDNVTSPLGWDASCSTVALEEKNTQSDLPARSRKELDDKMTRRKQIWPWKYLNKGSRVYICGIRVTQWTGESRTKPRFLHYFRKPWTHLALRWFLCSPSCIRQRKVSPHLSFDCETLTSTGLERCSLKVLWFAS